MREDDGGARRSPARLVEQRFERTGRRPGSRARHRANPRLLNLARRAGAVASTNVATIARELVGPRDRAEVAGARRASRRARCGHQPQVLACPSHRHDAIERRLAGDDERRRASTRAQLRAQVHRRRAGARAAPSAPARTVRVTDRRSRDAPRTRRRHAPSGMRGRDLRDTAAAARRPEQRRRAAAARAGRTARARSGCHAGGRRRRQDQRRRRARDAAPRTRRRSGRRTRRRRSPRARRRRASSAVVDLLDVVVEAACSDRTRTPLRRLVAERERDDAAALRQRVDGRPHPFPAALDAGNQDERRSPCRVSMMRIASVPQRLAGLQRVLNPLQRLALAAAGSGTPRARGRAGTAR